MIFHPIEDQDIADYTLAVIASNNVFRYLYQHVYFLESREIRFKRLVIGDAGLLSIQKAVIAGFLPGKISFLDLEKKRYESGFKTQSDEYREVIDNRIPFLRTLFQDSSIDGVVQLDADTAVIQNNFKMLDKCADMSLTVRPVTPYDHILRQFQVDYPNCGVIFWNKPRRWTRLPVTALPAFGLPNSHSDPRLY